MAGIRVTSGFFVAALVRRAFGAGAFAAVVRRGAEEAGAIFVIVDRLDGTADLYGPAAQTAFEDERPTDRLFRLMVERAERPDVSSRLRSEERFDPDLWVVEIEDREGRSFLDVVAE